MKRLTPCSISNNNFQLSQKIVRLTVRLPNNIERKTIFSDSVPIGRYKSGQFQFRDSEKEVEET